MLYALKLKPKAASAAFLISCTYFTLYKKSRYFLDNNLLVWKNVIRKSETPAKPEA
jgi:hypothetical protein